MTPEQKKTADRFLVKIVMRTRSRDLSAHLDRKDMEKKIALLLEAFARKNDRVVENIRINRIQDKYKITAEVM